MLHYYFPLLYFSCFVTVNEDEIERKTEQEKSLKWTFFSFNNFWKKWTQGNFVHQNDSSVFHPFQSLSQCCICFYLSQQQTWFILVVHELMCLMLK